MVNSITVCHFIKKSLCLHDSGLQNWAVQGQKTSLSSSTAPDTVENQWNKLEKEDEW